MCSRRMTVSTRGGIDCARQANKQSLPGVVGVPAGVRQPVEEHCSRALSTQLGWVDGVVEILVRLAP
jgi:hypothetical protein